jgi:hypothetical protein
MLSHPLLSSRQSAFALISVLALVSLAALTATAFLASARLERQATSSISTTTRLEMTLSMGRECAAELLDKVGQPGFGWNFVTTYWRTNIADELGYPLIGGPNARSNLRWTYYCGFTPATWTNLDTNVIGTFIKATNLICQSSFSNDIAAFMTNATNGFSANPTSKVSTTITLVGGRTSPPIGWVYIRQNIRTNPAATNTAYLPVARFAYFIEDLQGLIDAERMGGLTLRDTGTNAEEISMSNLTGVTIANLTNYTNARGQYITPSMLLTANGGFLSRTNDLRYFASRLRFCPFNDGVNWDRIPSVPINSDRPYYPTNAGFLKRSLSTNLDSTNGLTNIAYTITNNFPNFTNRAGGMNGTNYILALAANIIDYADTDSSATSTNINVSTNPVLPTNVPVNGFDSYPFVTQIFDQFVCTQTGTAPPVITVNTYLQFWNPSSISSPTTTNTLLYDFADTIKAVVFTNTTTTNTNSSTTPPRLTPLVTTNIVIPSLPANSGFITNITTVATNIPSALGPTAPMTWANFANVWINTNAATVLSAAVLTNSLAIQVGGVNYLSMRKGYYRMGLSLTNNETNWLGVVLGLRGQGATAPGVSGQNRLLADPRMLSYITLEAGVFSFPNVYWRGYPAEFTSALLSGHPGNWPDGYNTANNAIPTFGNQYAATNAPPLGAFTISDPAPCKISNFGSYTNICELGNIFDPIQWAPPISPAINNYANVDIPTGTTWTTNSIYGGGSTLRIGRPEHSRFAFTNLGGAYPTPNLGQSAVGLLDLFCVTNTYNWAGKININTAPPAVLAALAGGIKLTRDPNKAGSEVNDTMINAFTNGVMRFRQTYPFITPSQLAFISRNYGTNPANPTTCWTNTFSNNAVFSSSVLGGLNGVSSINDQGFEEWFAKIYALTTVQSFNYRIYVVAQLTDTNGLPKGAPLKKYYQLHLRNNTPTGTGGDSATPSVSQVFTYEAFY